MTSAESFWYICGCIMFGSAYFMEVPTAKALSELAQFKATEHMQLQAFDPPPVISAV